MLAFYIHFDPIGRRQGPHVGPRLPGDEGGTEFPDPVANAVSLGEPPLA